MVGPSAPALVDTRSRDALTGDEILARARALGPAVRAAAAEIEERRELPPALLEALTGAGVFRMAMPRAWGGPEMPPLEQIELIEVLSRADASVGWCVSILSDSGFYAAFLDEEVSRGIWTGLDFRTAGMLAPAGRAEPCDGGYRVSGRWAFGSGSRHADVVTGGCLVTRDGAPLISEDGLPVWRVAVLARDRVVVEDTWRVTGLAGSGSHHYRVSEHFVPEEHTFDVLGASRRSEPLYGYHGLFFANVPGVPLGMARAALDALGDIAEHKLTLPALRLLRDEYRAQQTAGECEAALGAARAYVFDVMGDVWRTLLQGDPLSMSQRSRVALCLIHAGQASRQVIERICDVVGSDALYAGHPLERLRRDAIAVSAHVVHHARTYATVGKVLLGGKPGLTFF